MYKDITDMPELKELLELKIKCYFSRLRDFAVNCQHIHNLDALSEKLNVDKEELYTVVTKRLATTGGVIALRGLTMKRIAELETEALAQLSEAVHPHQIAEMSAKLDAYLP